MTSVNNLPKVSEDTAPYKICTAYIIRTALTKAHQAGIDEAVEVVGKQKPVIVNMLQEDSLFIRHGIDGVIGYNEAKKEIIKALQDNK